MDQGVISYLKGYYEEKILKMILGVYDDGKVREHGFNIRRIARNCMKGFDHGSKPHMIYVSELCDLHPIFMGPWEMC